MNTSVTVLVIEDDPFIHDVIGEALVDGGFTVAQASTPEDARDMIDAPDAAYRALVTDINLAPGKPTGWDLARRAREINSDLPVVYMTGDCGDQWARRPRRALSGRRLASRMAQPTSTTPI
jgi:CheY-like chemotaxis protein